MRARDHACSPVKLLSRQRYWTVLDEDLQAVGVADTFLRYQRFGRDRAESTTKEYAVGRAVGRDSRLRSKDHSAWPVHRQCASAGMLSDSWMSATSDSSCQLSVRRGAVMRSEATANVAKTS
jgi:hypothetical protein